MNHEITKSTKTSCCQRVITKSAGSGTSPGGASGRSVSAIEAAYEDRLSGRVAVVTGGSRGIGRSIAEKLAERGAAVAVMFREHEAPAREFEAAARAKGRRSVDIDAH